MFPSNNRFQVFYSCMCTKCLSCQNFTQDLAVAKVLRLIAYPAQPFSKFINFWVTVQISVYCIVWIITNCFPQHSTSNSCTQERRKAMQNEKVARVIFMARYTFFSSLHSNTNIFEIHGKITESMLNISFKKLHSTEIEFPDNNSPDNSKNRKH